LLLFDSSEPNRAPFGNRVALLGRNAYIGDSPEFLFAAKSLGFEVVAALDEDPDLVLCLDWTPSARGPVESAKKRGIRCILVVFEPIVVIPENWLADIRSLFSAVIEVGSPSADPLLPWPQNWPQSNPRPFTKRLDRAVMVQGRKFSFVKGQQYSLRARVARSDARVDVYGANWDQNPLRVVARLFLELANAFKAGLPMDYAAVSTGFSKPLNWLGPTRDKHSTLSAYKASVVIENSPNYMSEKLFDALFSGCIPVYVGPPLDRFEVPRGLYLHAEPNLKSVLHCLNLALSMSHENWLPLASEYLSSPRTHAVWSSRAAFRRILRATIGS